MRFTTADTSLVFTDSGAWGNLCVDEHDTGDADNLTCQKVRMMMVMGDDGDEDDENTSGKKDKLMAAIEEDPDKVMEFMKQLTSGLYSVIDDKMKSTELSSAYKVYNDKEMDKELARYAETISKWEDKVKEKEDYYYNKFSQMEVALSKLQNQTSSISGLFNM